MTGPKHMDWDKRQVILGQFLLFIYVGDLNIQKLKKKEKKLPVIHQYAKN